MRHPGRADALVIAVLLVVIGACRDSDTDPEPNSQSASASEGATTPPPAGRRYKGTQNQNRGRTRPDNVHVTNAALDAGDRRRVGRAVRDLKELGFWDRLTKHVVSVRISTRAGDAWIPDDGHLADSQQNVRLEPHPGWECDVMIYSQALADDVDRQIVYYSEGRLASPPPTLRQFWAVIVAHEVAHCSPRGQRGEAYSTTWEGKVLEAFGAGRVGSPG